VSLTLLSDKLIRVLHNALIRCFCSDLCLSLSPCGALHLVYDLS
jgi:hypothetical protein